MFRDLSQWAVATPIIAFGPHNVLFVFGVEIALQSATCISLYNIGFLETRC